MSANAQQAHDPAHHDDHGGASHGSRKSYVIGFLLSVVLTAIPFYLVMTGTFSNTTTSLIIIALAVVQIIVHMIYFLHMDAKSEGGWNMMALIFTVVVVVITLTGSIWVMYHLVHNMMPVTVHDMSQMP
jgi:cytochrome o ubiquinol oxidase subunit IV